MNTKILTARIANDLYIKGPLGIVKTAVNGNENQIIKGVTKGFKVKFKLIGVGYKAILLDKHLEISLGFNRPVTITLVEGVGISLNSNGTIITGVSTSYLKLTNFMSSIKQIRPAYKDKYNGKGVK